MKRTTKAKPRQVVIPPQDEVYRGFQIHADARGYWFVTPHGQIKRSHNIESIRRQIDIVQMVLNTVRKPDKP